MMKNLLYLSFFVGCLFHVVICTPQDNTLPQDQWNCHGSPNPYAPLTAAPEFMNQVPNGKLYRVGGEFVDPPINVLHLWGTPYEMGYAAGQLTAPILKQYIPSVFNDIYSAIQPYLNRLPSDLQQLIMLNGTSAALQLTYDLVAPYVPPWYLEEMQGWADGSGIDYNMFLQINMIPEMVQAACSMFGAWGPAVQNLHGTLIQLRGILFLNLILI